MSVRWFQCLKPFASWLVSCTALDAVFVYVICVLCGNIAAYVIVVIIFTFECTHKSVVCYPCVPRRLEA
ncbi:hypothetical protein P171DRAFT_217494 [Karstenula rhodostoma CBS 690.94]|uniref:Uncharacterized protein n=1 Tax=Karstenula rhodostoma CBS 690.94 TaxID=1392251 RepID=A0A9P4PSX0_9PLEO|nr:hypothetical protein P171DRAFT_217494 [Karstenula rhodostoma CBS 690.94]